MSLDDHGTFVRQETWSGGRVVWPDGRVATGGGLMNIGEKSSPLNGQLFVRYSGLWGSPHRFYSSSGYWGPAYNETSMRADGFNTAWCAGLAGALDPARECWAADKSPWSLRCPPGARRTARDSLERMYREPRARRAEGGTSAASWSSRRRILIACHRSDPAVTFQAFSAPVIAAMAASMVATPTAGLIAWSRRARSSHGG